MAFATLIGTDTNSDRHIQISENLIQIAESQGFTRGDETLPIRPDQISLSEWSLELRGPVTEDADFFLAVTAPPGISPIPIKQTVAGPLFAVHVMSEVFGVWEDGDFREFEKTEYVENEFQAFVEGV